MAARTQSLPETVAELESFSYSIAHDMRAPLRSFSDLLLLEHRAQLDRDGQDYLQRISKAAARMDALIQVVLHYSNVVRSDAPLESDLHQLLCGILETYPALSTDRSDIHLKGDFPTVMGNEARLTQIFSNLIGNALKFVRVGERAKVEIWEEARDSCVRVFVRDQGIGIPSDQHQKIFGIFQRVDKSYEGTGIGLVIVKKAVERMGGTVGVESRGREGQHVLDPGQRRLIPG